MFCNAAAFLAILGISLIFLDLGSVMRLGIIQFGQVVERAARRAHTCTGQVHTGTSQGLLHCPESLSEISFRKKQEEQPALCRKVLARQGVQPIVSRHALDIQNVWDGQRWDAPAKDTCAKA